MILERGSIFAHENRFLLVEGAILGVSVSGVIKEDFYLPVQSFLLSFNTYFWRLNQVTSSLTVPANSQILLHTCSLSRVSNYFTLSDWQ